MTARKPQGMGWQSWIDQQIRDGERDGLFDDLPGKGKPLPGIDQPRDELWWVRAKLEREEIAYLPPGLQVRKDLQDARERMAACRREADVVKIVEEINQQIRYVNSHTLEGPPSNLLPLRVERELTRWRDAQPPSQPPEGTSGHGDVSVPAPALLQRWRRARRSRWGRGAARS